MQIAVIYIATYLSGLNKLCMQKFVKSHLALDQGHLLFQFAVSVCVPHVPILHSENYFSLWTDCNASCILYAARIIHFCFCSPVEHIFWTFLLNLGGSLTGHHHLLTDWYPVSCQMAN
jgi:hypothetical protein